MTPDQSVSACPRSRLPIGLGFVGGAFAYIAVLYPGFMSNDSVSQLLQARSGSYSDWHPPFMTWVWSLIDRVWPGPTGMLVLHTALIWSGAYLAWRFALKPWQPRIGALVLVGIMFTPQLFGIAGAIWKDNLMWGAMFVAIGCGFALARGGSVAVPACTMLVALLVAVCVRHNAIIAIYPLLAWGLSAMWRRNALTVLLVAVPVAGAIQLAALAANHVLTDQRKHAWVSLAIFDTIGTMAHSDSRDTQAMLFAELPATIRRGVTVEAAVAAHSPRGWLQLFDSAGGPLRRPAEGFGAFDTTDRAALALSWRYAVAAEPLAWLVHRWHVFRQLIGLDGDGLFDFVMMRSSGSGVGDVQDHQFTAGPYRHHEALQWRLERLSRSALFRPWTHLVLLICLAGWLAWRRDMGLLLLAFSGLAHEAALFVIAPSADYRYSHYMVFVTLLLVAILLTRRGREVAPRRADGR